MISRQWNKALEEPKKTDADNFVFWKECQVAFVEAKIQPATAADFFHSHAESRNNPVEKYSFFR
jgi:hypothetical protein